MLRRLFFCIRSAATNFEYKSLIFCAPAPHSFAVGVPLSSRISNAESGFILAARLKSESKNIKEAILKLNLEDGQTRQLLQSDGYKPIINQSASRVRKDANNRDNGLKKLQKSIDSEKQVKQHFNYRDNDKFLRMKGKIGRILCEMLSNGQPVAAR